MNKKRLLLIDLSSIFWMNWHATVDQGVSAAFENTIGKINQLREKDDLVAICGDSPPYFRKEILPTYKEQRDKPSAASLEQLTRVKERLAKDGLLLWESPGFEADDVIATAAHFAKLKGIPVLIASSDKDLLQIVDDAADISVLSVATGKLYRREDVIEKFGVDPGLLGDALAFIGDKSDNIPGAPGVGPKIAARLLLEYGNLQSVLANIDKLKGALQQSLFENAQAVRTARALLRLRTDVPIEWKQIYEKREPMPLAGNVDDYDDREDVVDLISGPAPKSEGKEPIEAELDSAQLASPTNGSTALVRAPQEWSMQLEPDTLGQAWKLAKGLLNSRLYTDRFGNAEAIWAVILRGREMGIGAATALDSLSFFEGKVNVGAHLLIARAKSHPDCEYFQFIGGDDTFAEWVTKNRCNPEPTKLKYTIEQADTAGLLWTRPGKQPGNWHKRRAEMLRKTAGVQLARIEYPGALHDAYCPEEMGNE
jgi:DNA polymerase-1